MDSRLSAETANLFRRGDRAISERNRLLSENAALHATLVAGIQDLYDAEVAFREQGNWTRVISCLERPCRKARLPASKDDQAIGLEPTILLSGSPSSGESFLVR